MSSKRIGLSIICLFTVAGIVGCSMTDQIFYEKWVPPIIAGLFLMGLVPWANHKYWQKRTKSERRWADENLKKQIISDFAEVFEGAFLYMERLSELKAEKERGTNLSADLKTELMKEEFLVNRLKLTNEMAIGKMVRLIEVYFDERAVTILKDWIPEYNKLRSEYRPEQLNEDHPFMIQTKTLLKAILFT